LRIAGRNLPVGGGGYLRLLPDGVHPPRPRPHRSPAEGPFMVYLHPWEIDAHQPRFGLGRLATLRGYHNLGDTEARLAGCCPPCPTLLLEAFPFAPARTTLTALGLLTTAPAARAA
jgi:hypothetical protein